jgi:energy-coupling factor transporter ATP-binding protein EcfA2
MKAKRKGIQIQCSTFRIIPDPVLDLWRDGRLHDSAVKVWVLMQRLAYEQKGEVGFNLICRYCGVGRTTLSRALKQLIEHGLIKREGQVYTVVFDQQGSPTVVPASPTVVPASPTVVPASPTVVPASPIVVPASPTVVPNLNSKSRGELRRHVDTIGESPETPTVRSAASLERLSSSMNGAQSAGSHIHISPEDLALLAQRYGIRFQRPPSPWACVMIRDLLNGEGGEGQIAILRALAERMNGFGGGECSAAAESTTTVGGQP